MKLTFTRDFYIPQNAIEIRAADCSAVAYLAPSRAKAGAWVGIGFSGKRNKPDFNYSFRDEQQARAHVAQHAAGVKTTEASRAEWKAKKLAARCSTPLQVWQKAQREKSITPADAAVCLRAVLAAKWPGVKFTVHTSRSLNVGWTDGPTYKEVESIAQNYSFQGFDGMIDLRYYKSRWLARDGSMSLAYSQGTDGSAGTCSEAIGSPHTPDAVECSGGPDFVFCSRGLSPAVKHELANQVCSRYGIEMPAHFESETDFERWLNTTRGGPATGYSGGEYLGVLVHRASSGALD